MEIDHCNSGSGLFTCDRVNRTSLTLSKYILSFASEEMEGIQKFAFRRNGKLRPKAAKEIRKTGSHVHVSFHCDSVPKSKCEAGLCVFTVIPAVVHLAFKQHIENMKEFRKAMRISLKKIFANRLKKFNPYPKGRYGVTCSQSENNSQSDGFFHKD